jgi:hypothetical protein
MNKVNSKVLIGMGVVLLALSMILPFFMANPLGIFVCSLLTGGGSCNPFIAYFVVFGFFLLLAIVGTGLILYAITRTPTRLATSKKTK